VIFLVIVGVLVAGASTAYVASDNVRYLARAGLEETRILRSRESIARLVADSSTPAELRASLQLVLDVRDYADSIGLDAGKTYTTYADVGRDTLLMVLQAAPPDCICPYTWKWPIVGRMPYKGFFDAADARREAARLEARGYDIYLRPAGAFSTLGWFEDPLFSTAVTGDSMELAATVFHEIAHNSLYVKSATPFNESFAQLVGYRAAEQFFRARGDTVAARRAAERWHDEQLLGAFYTELVGRLDSLYATHPDSAALAAGRMDAGRWASQQLEGPVARDLRTYTVGVVPERPVNNARLIGATIYRSHLDLFEAYYQQHDADISATVAELKRLMDGAKGKEAFARLAAAIEAGR
jgi:predicted aminopeptidase